MIRARSGAAALGVVAAISTTVLAVDAFAAHAFVVHLSAAGATSQHASAAGSGRGGGSGGSDASGGSVRSAEADAALGRVMQQVRTPPVALTDLSQAERAARLRERETLLNEGERALATLQVERALQSLDRAASILHAADTEMALVRAYLQQGEYRRAVAFVAHTAGAHREVAGGAALYAWLLNMGGHRDHALRLLSEAEQRFAGDALLAGVRLQLQSGHPLALPRLLAPPARLAPYVDPRVPKTVLAVSSGLLLSDGQRVLAPLNERASAGGLWVRNGLGQARSARIERRWPAQGLMLLRLDAALPAPPLQRAAAQPFPGSVSYAVEYPLDVAHRQHTQGWPLLSAGFVGAPIGSDRVAPRKLGVELPPGPRGGPVFDAGGRLMGIALPPQGTRPERLVTAEMLDPVVADAIGLRAQGPPPRVPADEIYEAALRSTVQVLKVP